MRWVFCALLMLTFAEGAGAQDFDALRGSLPVGPATFNRWSGFYLGGQIGYSDANADFSKATQPPVAYALRDSALEATSNPSQMSVLGTADHGGLAYGGFVGYNTQWQDLVLGAEANYNHTSLSLTAVGSPIERSGFSDGEGHYYTVGLNGTGTLTDLEYGSFRARAGWVLGSFMPYGFAGFALGAADIHVASKACVQLQPPAACTSSATIFTANSGENLALLYGFAIGGGLEVALTQNVFVRGELEYIRFAPFADILVSVASARVGAGVKF